MKNQFLTNRSGIDEFGFIIQCLRINIFNQKSTVKNFYQYPVSKITIVIIQPDIDGVSNIFSLTFIIVKLKWRGVIKFVGIA